MTKRFITIPNGNQVPLFRYTETWKKLLKMDPDSEVKGWQWFPVKINAVLKDMRDGMADRINRSLPKQELLEKRLFLKLDGAVRHGAISQECRACDNHIVNRYVDPPNRFCSSECRQSFL